MERIWSGPRMFTTLLGNKDLARTHKREARIVIGYLLDHASDIRPYAYKKVRLEDGSTLNVKVWRGNGVARAVVKIWSPTVIPPVDEPIFGGTFIVWPAATEAIYSWGDPFNEDTRPLGTILTSFTNIESARRVITRTKDKWRVKHTPAEKAGFSNWKSGYTKKDTVLSWDGTKIFRDGVEIFDAEANIVAASFYRLPATGQTVLNVLLASGVVNQYLGGIENIINSFTIPTPISFATFSLQGEKLAYCRVETIRQTDPGDSNDYTLQQNYVRRIYEVDVTSHDTGEGTLVKDNPEFQVEYAAVPEVTPTVYATESADFELRSIVAFWYEETGLFNTELRLTHVGNSTYTETEIDTVEEITVSIAELNIWFCYEQTTGPITIGEFESSAQSVFTSNWKLAVWEGKINQEQKRKEIEVFDIYQENVAGSFTKYPEIATEQINGCDDTTVNNTYYVEYTGESYGEILGVNLSYTGTTLITAFEGGIENCQWGWRENPFYIHTATWENTVRVGSRTWCAWPVAESDPCAGMDGDCRIDPSCVSSESLWPFVNAGSVIPENKVVFVDKNQTKAMPATTGITGAGVITKETAVPQISKAAVTSGMSTIVKYYATEIRKAISYLTIWGGFNNFRHIKLSQQTSIADNTLSLLAVGVTPSLTESTLSNYKWGVYCTVDDPTTAIGISAYTEPHLLSWDATRSVASVQLIK